MYRNQNVGGKIESKHRANNILQCTAIMPICCNKLDFSSIEQKQYVCDN